MQMHYVICIDRGTDLTNLDINNFCVGICTTLNDRRAVARVRQKDPCNPNVDDVQRACAHARELVKSKLLKLVAKVIQ